MKQTRLVILIAFSANLSFAAAPAWTPAPSPGGTPPGVATEGVSTASKKKRKKDAPFREELLSRRPYFAGEDFISADKISAKAELFNGPNVQKKQKVEDQKTASDAAVLAARKALEDAVGGIARKPSGEADILIDGTVFRTGKMLQLPVGADFIKIVIERVGDNGIAECKLICDGKLDTPFKAQLGESLSPE